MLGLQWYDDLGDSGKTCGHTIDYQLVQNAYETRLFVKT